MKNRTLILFILLLSFGCKEEFLEKLPNNTINTSNFYQTEEDAIAALMGAYQPLQWPKLYNFRIWTTDIWPNDAVVGAGGGEDGRSTKDINNQIQTPDNFALLDIMRGPSPGILRSNFLLSKLPDIEIDQKLKIQIEAEAKFLRALYYFHLVRVFGGVPLLTEPLFPGDNLYLPKNSEEEIYSLITEDLKFAVDNLPTKKEYPVEFMGRVPKGAAMALLAKVYLTLENYGPVPELCENIEGLGYRLNLNYADNFNVETENSDESLFEIQYTSGGSAGFWDDRNQSAWASCFQGPRGSGMVAGGWGWLHPTQEFVDSYEEGDLRKDVTIFHEGCPTFDGKEYNPAWSTTGYNVRKFLVTKAVCPSVPDNPHNFPVLRYADVLLMRAEALNELNKTDEALTYLNLVRDRAGLGSKLGLTKEEIKEAIIHERRMELAFEGHRWFDLIRIDNGQYAIDFLHSIGKVNMDREHLLQPIPQQEMDANPNLIQNPGY